MRSSLVVLVLLAVAPQALIADPLLEPARTQLEVAVNNRLAAAPPKAEAGMLLKAQRALTGVSGEGSASDVKRSAIAIAAAESAGSPDSAVGVGAAGLLAAIDALYSARKADAETVLAGLKVARDAGLVEKALNRGEAAAVAESFATGLGPKARFASKAATEYAKAKALATKLLLKEIRDGATDPGGGSNGADGTLAMLVGTTLWTADEIEATYTGSALTIRGIQHGSPDLTLHLMVPGVTGPGIYTLVPGTGQYVVSVSGLPLDFFLIQGGTLTIGSLDAGAGTVAGNFTFTALSPISGGMTVPSGQLSLTGMD